jgi:hypothetical protein
MPFLKPPHGKSPRVQRAHTLAPREKKPFGRISLSLLDFRWAPE